jgi:hypothetical protein
MRVEPLAGVVGLLGLMLATVAALPAAPVRPHAAQRPAAGAPAFPPPRARALTTSAHGGLPAVVALDGEVARLGRQPPRLEPLRRAFLESTNLAQFALDRLPRASAGDGASQYFIYLALDQCRSYLRSDIDGANLETFASIGDLTTEERIAWQTEYQRCRPFSVMDWSALGEALGDDKPGAEIEFASVWFERAAHSGYAPALAEQALRPSPYGTPERRAMLDAALPARSADVYWLLFAHSGEVQTGAVNAEALAWLIVACRAGQDCGEGARWYRGFVCAQEDHRCTAGQSALEYYWYAASPHERDEAWTQAFEIEASLRAERWEDVPLPELDSLDFRRLWATSDS